ncbi:MAG: hypothetical protein U0414_16895 [Polyangiaceae bacterium]
MRCPASPSPLAADARLAAVARFAVCAAVASFGSACARSDGADVTPRPATTGLPCDVARVMEATCVSCHSDPPVSGAPMGLTNYEELTSPSHTDAGLSYAARAAVRIREGTMPPGGGAGPGDASVLEAWVAAGAPRGTCGEEPDGAVRAP